MRCTMPRGGVTEAVHDHLDSDDAAREMLAREVVNLRALARWLVDTNGWEASEEAVVSALRRYDQLPTDVAREQQALLADATLDTRSGRRGVLLVNGPKLRRSLSGVLEELAGAGGGRLQVVEHEAGTTVIVDDARVDDVLERLGDEVVEAVSEELTELHVAFTVPEGGSATGVLGRLATILAVRDVDIVHAVGSGGEISFLVDDGEALRAYQALRCICSGNG